VKRSVLLLLAVTVALLLASGVAIARTFNCDGGLCRGTNSSDTMYGSSGRDNIYSLGGADLVRGNGGSDSVNGGDADDVVAGNSGFDAMNGGNGDDRMEAVDGMEDQISCGNGSHDIAVFDAGIDHLSECEDQRPR